MLDLLIVLVLVHLLTDFVLQSSEFCEVKGAPTVGQRLRAHVKHLLVHLIVNFTLIAITGLISWPVIFALLVLTLAHGLLDLLKSYLNAKFRNMSLWLLIADQLLHLGSIFAVVWVLFPGEFKEVMAALATDFLHRQSVAHLLTGMQKAGLFLSLLIIVTFGGAVLVREILSALNIEMTFKQEPEEDDVKTGRYIGAIERILTVIAMIGGRYDAIIALYASKTAIRFKHTSGNTKFEEYYILGTMISVLLAITAGFLLKTIL